MRPEAAARGPSPDSAEAACSLPLKIEESPSRGRSRARRAKLSDLPLKALRVPSDMNATVALLEVEGEAAPCAEKLTAINESLQGRERLLTATARASRLLLEAAEVRGAIPRVLGLIGEAAHVDRVNVLEARVGPMGEPLLVMTSEWTAEGVTPHLQEARSFSCDERNFSSVCAELRAGRSVCLSPAEIHAEQGCSGIEGIGTRTKAIVPIFVASEFIGVVSFDNTRQRRAMDPGELRALETAAGVIGAALHRERLVDDVRRERERAAEERVTELAKANAVIRGNLERLAGQTDLHSFMGHMLLEATRQFEAISGAVIVLKDSLQEWRVVAHVREGELAQPSFAVSVPVNGSPFTAQFGDLRGPLYLNIDRVDSDIWPGVLAFYRSEGAVGTVIYPLVFGARSVGFLVLTFQRQAEARRSVMALRLDQTRRAGLEIALRQLADRSTVAGGITCTFEGGGISTGLRPEHEHELLRIAQEAVSNAVRHARPHHVHITMTDQDADWELAVADDGVGMEQRPDVYAREGFGLSSMRQRAGAIGGDWRIESTPGAGTRVSVRMLK